MYQHYVSEPNLNTVDLILGLYWSQPNKWFKSNSGAVITSSLSSPVQHNLTIQLLQPETRINSQVSTFNLLAIIQADIQAIQARKHVGIMLI